MNKDKSMKIEENMVNKAIATPIGWNCWWEVFSFNLLGGWSFLAFNSPSIFDSQPQLCVSKLRRSSVWALFILRVRKWAKLGVRGNRSVGQCVSRQMPDQANSRHLDSPCQTPGQAKSLDSLRSLCKTPNQAFQSHSSSILTVLAPWTSFKLVLTCFYFKTSTNSLNHLYDK